MRLFLVVDETCFFHPAFVNELAEKTKDEIVGAILVTRAKNSPETYIIKHFWYLRPIEIIKLGARKAYCMLLDLLGVGCHSVRRAYQKNGIPFFIVKDSINRPEVIARIAAFEPDVILSSNPLYFGKQVLSLPQIACINRHSGLLPNNGGVWPGFQAVRKGERVTGVSIHTMSPVIDEGVVLANLETEIRPGESLFSIYQRCFAMSAEAALMALNKLRAGDFSPAKTPYPKNYYSFPDAAQWKEFRARGGRYI